MSSEQEEYDSLPPHYEEEFKDIEKGLPPYTCTVFKAGYVELKTEIKGDIREKDRSWKKSYFRLRGTLLEMYKDRADSEPFNTVSMYKVVCGVPLDYYRRDEVLRLTVAPTKDQYMFQPATGGLINLISWFEHINAAINISVDIDRRKIPRLLNYSRGSTPIRRSIHQFRTVTFQVGDYEAYLPMLGCLYNIKLKKLEQ